ncbi:hypothetical protein ES705_04849 [subsurface metagenome]
MGKLFGIVSQKIITDDKIDRVKNNVIQNNLRENSIFISNDKKTFLHNENLCIINLSKLTQNNNLLIILINGEIYNSNEIAKDLINRGCKLKNYTENELITYGYLEYGDSIFDKLNGVFSIVIYNNKRKELILVRDKFGSKPLFYYYSDNEFIFSSELNDIIEYGIKKEIDNIALNIYFALTYIPAPFTIYKNVNKVEAGSYVKLENKSVNKKKYYNFSEKIKSSGLIKDYNTCKKEIKYQLVKSIERRMEADKEIGLFLSGGIDSSILANIIPKVLKKTYSYFYYWL